MSADLPPSLRALYDACGPILRYRILRDVLGEDESYVRTAHAGLEVLKLPEVQQLLAAQQENGLWTDFRTSEIAALRLCEFGLESQESLERLREQVLLPTLLDNHALWEYSQSPLDEAGKRVARRILRDKALHLLCRIQRREDPVIRTQLEVILVEWEHYLAHSVSNGKTQTLSLPAPTADSYAAVCRYPWSDDEFLRVHELVTRLVKHAEANVTQTALQPLAVLLFRLDDKWQYLAQPPRLLHDLELAATLGVARDLDFAEWMLEELEARQDADGFFRFPDAGEIQSSWYFPLEKTNPDEFYVECTFRAELIFKLLAFDI